MSEPPAVAGGRVGKPGPEIENYQEKIMNARTSTHAKAQSRKESNRRFRSTRASLRTGVILILALLATPAVFAQDLADTIKIRTRVVFMDALVKDKRTGTPISDLKPGNFELFDDGKPRTISYFNSEGQARKPLALVLVLDLRDDGAGRFLKREEVRAAIVDELSKLPAGDEVAILAINTNSIDDKSAVIRNGHALGLTEFTRDRAQLERALARIPALVATAPTPPKADPPKNDDDKKETSMTVSAGTDKASGDATNAQKKEPDKNEKWPKL